MYIRKLKQITHERQRLKQSATYTKTEVDYGVGVTTNKADMGHPLRVNANVSDVQKETQVYDALTAKANQTSTYTKTYVDGLVGANQP